MLGLTQDELETVYLPMAVNGIKVLVRTDADAWRVEMPAFAVGAPGPGLGYRQTKQLDDKQGSTAAWGSLVRGTDTGDGWLQLQIRKDMMAKVGLR